MGVRRFLAAAALVGAALFGVGSAILPAGAVVGTGQARPAVITPNDAVPGTSSNVSLVSHIAPGKTVTDPTPAGQYAALAIAGNCAYIGRRNYNSTDNADNGLGVQVVDISDPESPRYLGNVPHSADFTDTTARELRAVEQYHLLVVLDYARYTGGGDVGGQAGQSNQNPEGGFNVLQAYHINPDCSATLLSNYDMGPVKPHEFYLWLDPQRPGRVIAYVTTPFGPPQMEVVDFSSCVALGATPPPNCAPQLLTLWDGAYPQPNNAAIDNSGLGNYLHSLSVSPDGKTGYMADWNAGFFTVDTSQVANDSPAPVIVGTASTSKRDDWSEHNGPTGQGGDAHSAVWVPTTLARNAVKPYVVLTDEDYLGVGDCPFGWMRIDRVDPVAPGGPSNWPTVPTNVSSFGLPENLMVQEAVAVTFASKPNALLADPNSCAGYNRDHPGFIGASSAWPGGQVPANTYTSHNPTTLPDLVLTTWYGGGFRVVDIANPAKPTETGFFVPTPEPKVSEELDDGSGVLVGCYYPVTPTKTDPSNCTTRNKNQVTTSTGTNYVVHPQVAAWSYPIVKNGLIYFVDNRNGLYVVKYHGPYDTEVRRTAFAEGNSNNAGSARTERDDQGDQREGDARQATASSAAAPAPAAQLAPAVTAATQPAKVVLALRPVLSKKLLAGGALVVVIVLAAAVYLLRRRRA